MSPRGPGPARRVAWVDADRGAQVIRSRRAATQIIMSVLAHRTPIHLDPVVKPRDDKEWRMPRRGMTDKKNAGTRVHGDDRGLGTRYFVSPKYIPRFVAISSNASSGDTYASDVCKSGMLGSAVTYPASKKSARLTVLHSQL